jgi:DNA-binding XRE family transcriptional regulator
MRTLSERLLSKVKVDDSGCWQWTASKVRRGYGQINFCGKMLSAHRVSFEVHCGEIPAGMFVLHKCDNRGCINPAHLFLGTNDENMADMVAKDRQARGSNNGRAKLTEHDIRDIRAARGILQIELARRYGVSKQQISKIISHKLWPHL